MTDSKVLADIRGMVKELKLHADKFKFHDGKYMDGYIQGKIDCLNEMKATIRKGI